MEKIYLVETWRKEPYDEVLEDDFTSESEAISYAKQVFEEEGVIYTKVFEVYTNSFSKRIKITEFNKSKNS